VDQGAVVIIAKALSVCSGQYWSVSGHQYAPVAQQCMVDGPVDY